MSFKADDVVYLLDDVCYDGVLYKRGQQFTVIRVESRFVRCRLEKSELTFLFSDDSLTKDLSEVSGSFEHKMKVLRTSCLVVPIVIVIITFLRVLLKQ